MSERSASKLRSSYDPEPPWKTRKTGLSSLAYNSISDRYSSAAHLNMAYVGLLLDETADILSVFCSFTILNENLRLVLLEETGLKLQLSAVVIGSDRGVFALTLPGLYLGEH